MSHVASISFTSAFALCPADERNIEGVVMNVNEHGGYKIGTKVGQIKGYMCRNQVQFVANDTLDVSEVLVSDMSVRGVLCQGIGLHLLAR
jgi:hypothetical protein